MTERGAWAHRWGGLFRWRLGKRGLGSRAVGTCREAPWGTLVVPAKRGVPPAYPRRRTEAEACEAGGRQPGAAAQCPRGPAAPRGRRPHPARRRRADVSSPEAPPPAAVDAQAAPEKLGRGEPARAGAASRALRPSFVRSRDEALAQMARRGQLPALGAACGRSPRSLSRAPSVF